MKNQEKIFVASALVGIIIVTGLHFIFDKPFNKTKEKKDEIINMEDKNTKSLKVEILKEGSGVEAKSGNTVTVHYVGTLTSGQKFDSSVDRGTPFTLKLGTGSVIRGWEEGLLGMKAGEKRRLTIPPELGYGSAGAGGVIPPNATLIFEIEMLEIK